MCVVNKTGFEKQKMSFFFSFPLHKNLLIILTVFFSSLFQLIGCFKLVFCICCANTIEIIFMLKIQSKHISKPLCTTNECVRRIMTLMVFYLISNSKGLNFMSSLKNDVKVFNEGGITGKDLKL